MVPGMSGSEIRASLEAVNWDTNIAVKNLKIDKLYRFDLPLVKKYETNMASLSVAVIGKINSKNPPNFFFFF